MTQVQEQLRVQLQEDSDFLVARMDQWKIKPTFHLIAYFKRGENTRLAETIQTLGAQLYGAWKLTVISEEPVPDKMIDTLPVLNWVTAPETSHKPTVINIIGKNDADWVGFIRPGDQLETQTLILLADYINTNMSWKMIYTDEDRFNAEGDIVETLKKPDFDLTELQQSNFIGRGVYLKQELFDTIDGLSGLFDSTQALSVKVVEQVGDFSIGHIPVVLYHTAI